MLAYNIILRAAAELHFMYLLSLKKHERDTVKSSTFAVKTSMAVFIIVKAPTQCTLYGWGNT